MPCYDGRESESERDAMERINKLTRWLCSVLSQVEERDLIVNIERPLYDWWQKHKRIDAKREGCDIATSKPSASKYKPLDFVIAPSGSVGIVAEVTRYGDASVDFITRKDVNEKTAWWRPGELKVVGSLPHLLAGAMAHPSGSDGKRIADEVFGLCVDAKGAK